MIVTSYGCNKNLDDEIKNRKNQEKAHNSLNYGFATIIKNYKLVRDALIDNQVSNSFTGATVKKKSGLLFFIMITIKPLDLPNKDRFLAF